MRIFLRSRLTLACHLQCGLDPRLSLLEDGLEFVSADFVDAAESGQLLPNFMLHGLFLNKHNDSGAASVALAHAAAGLAARQRGLASRDAAFRKV